MRQIIKYPGSKWNLSNWIIDFFPEHHSYLEPFFGSGAVLFNKPPSKIETINDLDDEVVNLFECIKKDPEKLAKMIWLTPYSRKSFNDAYINRNENRYIKAAKFIARCDMGQGIRTNGKKTGFKMDIQGREAAYAVKHWNKIPDLIIQCAERLKQVQIENRPAIGVIERFNFQNVLIYADPPYLLSTRHGKQYRCEMEESNHIDLLEVLKNHKGTVIISGYENSLYNDILHNWHKEYRRSRTQTGKHVTEVLWMNFIPNKQIEMEMLK